MVEVFKTNVKDTTEAKQIVEFLSTRLPESKINFDLHDCDKILRVEGDSVPTDEIIGLVSSRGFFCIVLD